MGVRPSMVDSAVFGVHAKDGLSGPCVHPVHVLTVPCVNVIAPLAMHATPAGGIVSAMQSVEGESVKFKSHVATAAAKGKVEAWLLEVEERMFEAVHDVSGRGVQAYTQGGLPRHEWALQVSNPTAHPCPHWWGPACMPAMLV